MNPGCDFETLGKGVSISDSRFVLLTGFVLVLHAGFDIALPFWHQVVYNKTMRQGANFYASSDHKTEGVLFSGLRSKCVFYYIY
jgi:hypothetical protein